MTRADSTSLTDRIDALADALDRAAPHLDPEVIAEARSIVAKARARVGHGTEHTVIALAGSTGVGKSSMFNAVVGESVSDVGVRRPTTGVAHAAVFGEGADALLDWLRVGRRHRVAGSDRLTGLVLVDLPDFDSTEDANRMEVDRLVDLVDAMVWVTDPQKYADEALHVGYLRPLSGHADVLRFVMNKIDTVPEGERDSLVADFRGRLGEDGFDDPKIHAASVATRNGLAEIDAMIADVIVQRRAVVDRMLADLRAAAENLTPSGVDAVVDKQVRRDLVARLASAAGADRAGEIVAAQHRKDARMAMSWPPARVIERFRRRHPISELPRASASGVARSEIQVAVRDTAEALASDLEPAWLRAVRAAGAASLDDVALRLTATTQGSARAATKRPRWWTPVAWLQRMVTLVAVVGAIWLVGVAVLGGFFKLDTEPLLIDTPGWEWIPLPSLMVLGGALVGLLIALLVRIPVAVAAKRRAVRVRSDLRRRVAEVADDTVLAAMDDVLSDRRAIADSLATVTAS